MSKCPQWWVEQEIITPLKEVFFVSLFFCLLEGKQQVLQLKTISDRLFVINLELCCQKYILNNTQKNARTPQDINLLAACKGPSDSSKTFTFDRSKPTFYTESVLLGPSTGTQEVEFGLLCNVRAPQTHGRWDDEICMQFQCFTLTEDTDDGKG